MTEAIQSPGPPPVTGADRPVQALAALTRENGPAAQRTTDQDGWALLLVPTTICLVMFVVAFWW